MKIGDTYIFQLKNQVYNEYFTYLGKYEIFDIIDHRGIVVFIDNYGKKFEWLRHQLQNSKIWLNCSKFKLKPTWF